MLDPIAMNSMLALFLPVTLLTSPVPEQGPNACTLLVPSPEQGGPRTHSGDRLPLWDLLTDAFRAEPQEQVRIERRVIVRISPRMPLQEVGPSQTLSVRRFAEKRMSKCVPIKGISSVQISQQNKLLLFMHDRRIISVKLEKSCSPRDFYSGFYVENSQDGMICAGRDTLHSRAGVNCEVSKLHKLVPDDD